MSQLKGSYKVHAACRGIRFAWETALLVVCLACLSVGQHPDIQNLITSGNLDGMRWPNFSDYRNWLQKFYEPTGFAPAWLQSLAAGTAGPVADRGFQKCWEERARPGGLRRFALGRENPRAARLCRVAGWRVLTSRSPSALCAMCPTCALDGSIRAFQSRTERGTEEVRLGPVSTRPDHDRSGSASSLGRGGTSLCRLSPNRAGARHATSNWRAATMEKSFQMLRSPSSPASPMPASHG